MLDVGVTKRFPLPEPPPEHVPFVAEVTTPDDATVRFVQVYVPDATPEFTRERGIVIDVVPLALPVTVPVAMIVMTWFPERHVTESVTVPVEFAAVTQFWPVNEETPVTAPDDPL